MKIQCLLIINNLLLRSIIENYISRTPFLIYKHFHNKRLNVNYLDLNLYDIIIVERECLSFYDFENLIDIKPTIVLSNIPNQINLRLLKRTLFTNSSLTHNDFVNHISILIDKS